MLLQMKGISKHFGGVQALQEVDFDLNANEVHALVGENGAGKSTLMKILSGAQPADQGSISLAGENISLRSVTDAQAHGIIMVFQELTLVPDLSVAENLFLGHLSRVVNYQALYKQAEAILADVGLQLEPSRAVRELSVGEQQLVAIARALAQHGKILILDEPTAALSAAETERLFELIEGLRGRGVGIVYISHRLEEIFRITDRVTVLRDGKLIATNEVASVSTAEVVRQMVGRQLQSYSRSQRRVGATLAKVDIQTSKIAQLNIEVKAGEILGLAGVVGSGRGEVITAMFGYQGHSDWGKHRVHEPRDAIADGIFLVPSDRKTQGLVLELNIRENTALAILPQISRGGIIQPKTERQQVTQWIKRLSIRPPEPEKLVWQLSGGNQQKVVVGKALATQPKILLLDEPTRGVDVGARHELYDMIEQLALQGLGVIVSSSDSEELVSLCDRVLVFRQQKVVTELTTPFSYEEVVAYVTGAR